MKRLIGLLLLLSASVSFAQTNMVWTNIEAQNAVHGNYDPADYVSSSPITDHYHILCDLQSLISPDSLKSYLETLVSFETRHTFSDTSSNTRGIGAARRWAFSKFAEFSAQHDNRLLPGYFSFDRAGTSCGDFYDLRNIVAVLPGSDTTDKAIIIIEAHIDSRCEGNCDSISTCPGAEDNGSGSALVLELARTMSKYTLPRTVMFMLTIGEEQGLLGADAMSDYCANNGVLVKAVQNNDVIGGIICGNTSSPPSCPGLDHIDSTQVRLFSNSTPGFPHRNFTRTIKLWYEEKMLGMVDVPMTISIMNQEDRTGRGGDHQPFRQRGYRNCRFTAANEHGDAGVGPGYTDRQHTPSDILGVDTNSDLVIDSFYVDFNYLRRNTVINGMSAVLGAIGPEAPAFQVHDEPTGIRVSILSHHNMPEYRVAVRLPTNMDWDYVYRTTDTSFVVPGLDSAVSYAISVAAIDANGVMGNFTGEIIRNADISTPPGTPDNLPYATPCNLIGLDEPATNEQHIRLLPCRPNPFQHETQIAVYSGSFEAREGTILITDIQGRPVERRNVTITRGNNFFTFTPEAQADGVYFCRLVVDHQVIGSQKMLLLEY